MWPPSARLWLGGDRPRPRRLPGAGTVDREDAHGRPVARQAVRAGDRTAATRAAARGAEHRAGARVDGLVVLGNTVGRVVVQAAGDVGERHRLAALTALGLT